MFPQAQGIEHTVFVSIQGQPSYLHSLFTPVRKLVQLRLSSSDLLFVRTVNTSIGARILAVGVLTLFNMLPFGVKSIKNIVNSDVI